MIEKIQVANNKYTVCLPDDTGEYLEILRYGDKWRDCTGDSLIYCLAVDLYEARKLLKLIRGMAEIQLPGLETGNADK